MRPRTRDSYRPIVRSHLLPAFGHLRLARLGPDEIQRFYCEVAERVSPKTVMNVHGVLHKALDQAALAADSG